MQTILQIMLGATASIALGVIANLLTPFFKAFFRKTRRQPPVQRPAAPPPIARPESRAELDARRAYNRQRLGMWFFQLWTFALSFFVVFVALWLSLLWANGPRGLRAGLDFTSTRLAWDFVLAHEQKTAAALIMAMVLYLPCLWLAYKLTDLTSYVVDAFVEVNRVRYLAFVALWMFVIALLLAGHLTYLLHPNKAYLDALLWPFIAVGAGFFFFGSGRRR